MLKIKNISFTRKLIYSIIVIVIVAFIITVVSTLSKIYQPNVITNEGKKSYLLIPTGATLDRVCQILYEKNYIINRSSFEWLAEKKHYQHNIKPGRYKIKNGMSNNELINLLRSGAQEPVKLTFNNIRTKDQFAGVIARQIEADSISILKLLNDDVFLQKFNNTSETVLGMFIPNTYEFLWNTDAKTFLERMNNEYKKFWTEARVNKSKEIGFSQNEIITLASIVDEESNKYTEYPVIAGVYINRLKTGMPLQADPTIKFALGDFTIKRVLTKHLDIESPYNTYKHKGLPPGPIAMPSIKAIDGVLNYQKHSYLYFCAKSDFSGYHAFAKTLSQHNQNARLYQNALNHRKIFD